MKKEYIKYGSITLIALFILAFVYPTIYRYDKYEQKIPVRINRITGSTEMLSAIGWQKAEVTAPTKTEMQQFQDTMDQKFNSLKQEIEIDVGNKLVKAVTASIQDKITKVEKEIGAYKEAQLDPNNSFGLGSTKEDVKKIMGIPTSILPLSGTDVWYYGRSDITFKDNKIASWHNYDNNLHLK